MKTTFAKVISILLIIMLTFSFTSVISAYAASAVYDEVFEGECMDEINRVRKANGAGNVTYDMAMAKLAGVRAVEISKNFSHTRPNGKNSYSVYEEYGYTKPKAVGETIGYATRFDGVPDMINLWMSSSSHKSIITSTKYTKFGMASYKGSDGKTYIALMMSNKEGSAYIVSFNANGGTGAPPSQVKTHGTKMTVSKTVPTRSGYDFANWNTRADGKGTSYSPGGTYSTDAGATFYAQWKVKGAAVTLSSISVKTMPSKTTYNVGDSLNTSGLVIKAAYSDGSSKDITSGFTCSPTKLSTAGTQKITVTYSGKTTSFNVTVKAASTPDQPSSKLRSVSVDDITLNYKSSAALKPKVDAASGLKYTIKYESSNTKVATVDSSGKVYGAKKGTADIRVTVTASDGSHVTDTCKVTVKYTALQWIIMILLFGWIWY
ncbi:MAG: bacterial Ig-like domain-containing protein [Clostridia bacterium]|nr:bacterial Ig-like domain-containing protein [Clostridia bacterium]